MGTSRLGMQKIRWQVLDLLWTPKTLLTHKLLIVLTSGFSQAFPEIDSRATTDESPHNETIGTPVPGVPLRLVELG